MKKGLLFSLPLLLAAAILLCLVPAPAAAERPEAPEMKYLSLKGQGLYDRAMEELFSWTLRLADPAMMELNLFRIDELIACPEQFARALEIYSTLENTVAFRTSYSTRKRLMLQKQKLLLRMGRLSEAQKIKEKLHFLDFRVMGPFQSGSVSDFEKKHPVLKALAEKSSLRGKSYPVSWFSAVTGSGGSIDMDELLPDTEGGLFYFYRPLRIEKPGVYRLSIGKNGFCDVILDGRVIFRNRQRHGYSPDQYFMDVSLTEGRHELLIRTDGTEKSLKLSCRVDFIRAGVAAGVTVISRGFWGAAGKLPRGRDAASLFRLGYIFHEKEMNSPGDSRTVKLCSGIESSSEFYSRAQMYSGLSLESAEEKESCYKNSLKVDDRNAEVLFLSVMIRLDKGFLYDAWPMLERLKKADASGALYLSALIDFYKKRGWDHEARISAGKFRNTACPSRRLYHAASLDLDDKMYHDASVKLARLLEMDVSDTELLRALNNAYLKCGKPDKSAALLTRISATRYNDINLLLALAHAVRLRDGAEKALPYLAAAGRRSPQNRLVFRELGMLYRDLGRPGPALFYLERAAALDPDNYELRELTAILKQKDSGLDRLAWKGLLHELESAADAHSNEQAVYLLNEQLYQVNQDGSYEKRIRCIVKIYNEQAIDDFSAQHVTYEPGIDSVENIRCAVINGGESIEATERYVRQLSDPESRLYYNLEAVMIQVPGLRRGSLLDFSYTLRNRGGAEFRNSYSETLHIGGPYRTMLYNIALSHPDERPIYMHRRGIEEGAVTVEHVNGSQLFRIRISDRAPVKNEAAMPPRQEILPALYFTSHRDWNDLALWYRSLLRNRMVVSDEMKRDLAAILSTEKKKLEIVRRIYNHVTGSIRYVGFELGIGALQPRSTDQTYHSRMGDCKDIALVLAAMLREAGIDASIALVQTRDRGKVNRSVPSTQGFNHALCHVNLEGGFFLDGTLNNSSFRELPPEDRDIEALVVNEKSWSFINTGSPLYEESVDSAVTEVIMDAEGGAAFRRELFKRGNAAALARQDLRDVKKKERTLNEYWNRIFPGSSVNSLKVADSSRDNPVKYGYGLRLKNYAVKAGKGLLFSPFPVQSDYYRSYAMNRTRRFPIIFSGPSRVESSMSIRVPQGFRPVSLPGGGTREHPLFSASFGYAYDAEKNIITLKSVVRFSTYSVPAEEYGAFRDLARFIQELESGKILLKRIAPGRGNS